MISVIIPVRNEAARLPLLLECLAGWHPSCGLETIVVDGASEDNTARIALSYNHVELLRHKPGRGAQLNAGAKAASGRWLWFLHADTLPQADALTCMEHVVTEDAPLSGGFRMRFDASRPVLRWIGWWSNRRAATGWIYGDQALFVRSDRFDEIGGFVEDDSMEDLDIAARLRAIEKPVCMSGCVVTSSRRFDRHGDLRSGLESLRLTWSWRRGHRKNGSRIFFSEVR